MQPHCNRCWRLSETVQAASVTTQARADVSAASKRRVGLGPAHLLLIPGCPLIRMLARTSQWVSKDVTVLPASARSGPTRSWLRLRPDGPSNTASHSASAGKQLQMRAPLRSPACCRRHPASSMLHSGMREATVFESILVLGSRMHACAARERCAYSLSESCMCGWQCGPLPGRPVCAAAAPPPETARRAGGVGAVEKSERVRQCARTGSIA